MQTAKNLQRLGWALAVLGLFIAGLMGIITFNLAPSLIRASTHSVPASGTDSGMEYTGGHPMLILGLFGVLILLGLSFMMNGISQIRTGLRNKWMLLSTAVLLVLLIIAVVGTVAVLP
jgi:hypothetical protein